MKEASMQAMPLKPWYREPWPWILMAGPAVVVIAGFVTLALAVGSFDGLVAEDYYKRGLAVNQVLTRVHRAQTLGIRATLTLGISSDERDIKIAFDGTNVELPRNLQLTLTHPTRAGMDQRIALVRTGDDAYTGRIEPLVIGRWQAIIEDMAGEWRILGELSVPGTREAVLSGS
jgi:hypothetical protein